MQANVNLLVICRYPFNVLLLNIGSICWIECILNMIPSFIYLMFRLPDDGDDDGVTFGWQFGWIACRINSYLMELTPLIYTLMLITLLVDRAFALKDPGQYKKKINVARQRCYLVLYWLLAIVSVLPVAVDLIDSWPFPDRYSCQVRFNNRFGRSFSIFQ